MASAVLPCSANIRPKLLRALTNDGSSLIAVLNSVNASALLPERSRATPRTLWVIAECGAAETAERALRSASARELDSSAATALSRYPFATALKLAVLVAATAALSWRPEDRRWAVVDGDNRASRPKPKKSAVVCLTLNTISISTS